MDKKGQDMTLLKLVRVVLVLACLATLTGQLPQNEAQAAGGDKTMLSSYLWQLGKRFDCYFTVEQYRDGSPLSHEALSMSVKPDSGLVTIEDLPGSLGKQLEGYEVLRSPDNPAVFHISASKAKSNPAYWLDKRMDLCFQGSPANLFYRIVSSDKQTVMQNQFAIPAPPSDSTTRVTVAAKGLTTRSILTNFLPLSRYSRVLWGATTEVLKEGRTDALLVDCQTGVPKPGWTRTLAAGTQVVYVSLWRSVKSEDTPSTSLVPFSEGEDALYRNAKSPEAVAAAIDYINAQMKTESPFQVRWAMFYLGKQGVPEAVPLLLEHLAYKYTTCGVLEESYPAALALSMMGKQGSEAALKAMNAETDGLRLKLLCRVVLLVEGQDAGAKAVEAEAAKLSDEQRQRIRVALKAAAEPQPLPAAPAAK
jgi:hypothetical protein